MASQMPHIQAMPYAPGQVRGYLRRPHHADLSGAIVLLHATEIDQLQETPAGIVVIDGAPFSHTMISLLRWGVPAVIVDKTQARSLSEGMLVTLDGGSGLISTGKVGGDSPEWQSPAPPPGRRELVTADGSPVFLRSSVRDAEGASDAASRGASAIGLVRTEFLQPGDGSTPDRAFYEHTLGEICRAAGTLNVTIRLLDVSPDKYPPWLPAIKGAQTPLGLQGVRLFDTGPVDRVIEAQLEAIKTLSNRQELKLIIPFLSRYEELVRWRDHIRDVLPGHIPIGAMVETPSAALDMARWLDAVDFVAVGCNDLVQNTFAADRDQPVLNSLLDPYEPVLYRLFKQMAESVSGELDRVQLCGLLPQFAGVMPLFLGMGYRVFSVEAMLIPHLAQVIQGVSIDSARELAEKVCEADRSSEVRKLLLPGGV